MIGEKIVYAILFLAEAVTAWLYASYIYTAKRSPIYADVEEFRNVVLPLWDKFADSVGGIDFVNAAKAALGY